MQHGLLVDNPPGAWSEVGPACLTRKILSLVGRLWIDGQQRHPECSRLAGLSPSVIHHLAKFRETCEDLIFAAACVVYQQVPFLGSLFKGYLGARREEVGMRKGSMGNTMTGFW